ADGRYVIDTRGETDVVMKLFGPNSETSLIAEDDDSGLDTNARVAGDLISGEYFVQVRHYSRQSGTGKYSIKVQKL
ncbi:MAG: peptidase, partial [Nitrospira sp.]|nr:peptidase [Nitrospira sp.]